MAIIKLLSREKVLERTLEKLDRIALREMIEDGRVSNETRAKRASVKAKRQR